MNILYKGFISVVGTATFTCRYNFEKTDKKSLLS